MVDTNCEFCEMLREGIHVNGCPKHARAAWQRGYNHAVNSQGQVESASASYMLGYKRGQADLKKVEEANVFFGARNEHQVPPELVPNYEDIDWLDPRAVGCNES